jgi:hypothetical protein
MCRCHVLAGVACARLAADRGIVGGLIVLWNTGYSLVVSLLQGQLMASALLRYLL